jgi:hypothetical protein
MNHPKLFKKELSCCWQIKTNNFTAEFTELQKFLYLQQDKILK